MKRLVSLVIILSIIIISFGQVPIFAQVKKSYPYTWVPASNEEYAKAKTHRWIYNTPQEYTELTGKKIAKYQEAPMLAELVKQGKLPPIEKRLPEEPLVINPIEKSGSYGGAVTTVTTSSDAQGHALHINNMEAPLRPNVGLTLEEARPRPNVPNVVKNWDIARDLKSITLYLRKGLKWSDGEPFTADDIMFWYEDILLNKDLSPTIDRRWMLGGQVWKFRKIDDYTVKIEFATPNPAILYKLATWGPEEMCQYPKHYLIQFHPKYTDPKKLDDMTKKAGFKFWYELFWEKARHGWGGLCEMPTLSPYVLKEKSQTQIILERNPYYWKIDTEGKQLPYLDRIIVKVVSSGDVYESMAIAGEFDFAPGIATINYPALAKNAEKGQYKVLIYPYANRAGGACVSVNQTYKDDMVLRKIFQDKRFRIALSLAINRDEMNDILFFGKGQPTASTVLPISMFYTKGLEKTYTQYDPEKANRLLDSIGLKWDAEHKFRLRPDGKKLSLIFDIPTGAMEGYDVSATAELLVKYWRAIGLDVTIKSSSWELWDQRVTGNLHQLSLGGGAACTDDNLFMAPNHYVLYHDWSDGAWGPLWVKWYLTGGKIGEKPPEDILKVTKKWEQLEVAKSFADMARLGKEIIRWSTEQLLTIGLVGMVPGPIVIRKNLRNFPPTGLGGGIAGTAWIDYYYTEAIFLEPPLFDWQK